MLGPSSESFIRKVRLVERRKPQTTYLHIKIIPIFSYTATANYTVFASEAGRLNYRSPPGPAVNQNRSE